MNTEITNTNTGQRTAFRRWKWWLTGIALTLIGVLLSRSDARGFPVTGVVIDGDTNKPIPHVWVTQEWDARNIVTIPFIWGGGRIEWHCEAFQLTQADENGWFRFEKPAKELPDAGPNGRWYAAHNVMLLGYAFAEGYVPAEAIAESSSNKKSGEVRVVLRKRQIQRDVLMRTVRRLMQPTIDCGNSSVPMPQSLLEANGRRIREEGVSAAEFVEWIRADYARSGWNRTEDQLKEFPEVKNFLRYVAVKTEGVK